MHSADGTRLHTEVFGPRGVCALDLIGQREAFPLTGSPARWRVWHEEQINDLSRDFRVIAYDHRGHGRSGVPTQELQPWTTLPPTSTPPSWRFTVRPR